MGAGDGALAWEYLRRNPNYRDAWEAATATPVFEKAPFPLRVQTEADLATARFALLAWADPEAADGEAGGGAVSPFWAEAPMLRGKLSSNATPLLALLDGAGARLEGLRLADGCLNPFAMIDAETAAHDGDYREECFAMLAGVLGRMCRRRGSVAGFTVAGDGTVIADAGSATSRIPGAGVRLSESLATSHESRAAEARTLSGHFSAEAGQARNTAVTDATALVERYAHDVSTGEAYARGITESESAQVQALESHFEKMSETTGIRKDQIASLTGDAKFGGGSGGGVRFGADGTVSWRGQTIEHGAWNRMKDYDESHQVTELFSRVSDASRRYSTQSGKSELASLDESLSANLTRMQRFEERASLAGQESESWSEQAAQVRAEAHAIDRELGQPFFAWLSDRTGTDGRPIGAAGAIRIASPQTPEDAEVLREHAAAFIAEQFPAPPGPDPATVGGRAEYDAARDSLTESYGLETVAAHAGSSEDVRNQAYVAGAPIPGETPAGALGERTETRSEMTARMAGRDARTATAQEDAGDGRARVGVETDRSLPEHVTRSVPGVGGWVADKIYGSAGNAAPDGPEDVDGTPGTGGEPAETPPRPSAADRKRWRHGE